MMMVFVLQDYLSDSGIMYEVVSNLPKVSVHHTAMMQFTVSLHSKPHRVCACSAPAGVGTES